MRALTITLGLVLVGCIPQQQGQGGFGYPMAQAGGSFAGTWVTQGATLTLQESGGQVAGNVQGSGFTGQVQGVVANGQLSGKVTMADGSSTDFYGQVSGDQLQIAVPGRAPVMFTRSGGAAQVAGAQPAAYGGDSLSMPSIGRQGEPGDDERADEAPAKRTSRSKGKSASNGGSTPMPGKAVASGQRVHDDAAGWEVHAPRGWKYQANGTQVVFGHDKVWGGIVVSFAPGLQASQMERAVAQQIAQLGAQQRGEARTFKARGGQGLVVELTGKTQQGEVEARAIGIAGPKGVLAVLALAPSGKLDDLRKYADEIAQSAKFFTPKESPARQYLVGAWWHYRGNSSTGSHFSAERTLELCADGTFYDSSESSVSVTAENRNPSSEYYGSSAGASGVNQGGGAGTWSVTGDAMRGQLRLQFNNGSVEQKTYAFYKHGGGDIDLDDRWFGRSPERGGRCTR